jgi:hypothetical protein
MQKGKVIPFPSDKRASFPRPKAYILRVYLVSGPYGEESVGQEIFRTLKVRGDQTLEDLHYAIFCSYEREHDRYYEFCLGMDPDEPEGVRYTCGEAVSKYGLCGHVKPGGKVGLAPLATVDSLGLTNDQFFGYWFDLIEEWIHLIHVISIEPADGSVEYPLLVEKEGRPPTPAHSESGRRDDRHGPDSLREEDFLVLLIGELQMRWRKQLENAPLKPNTRLRTALNKIPSHWLEAICQQADLTKVRTRKGRLEALAHWLPREGNLRRIWNSLPLPSREVLSWMVLEKSGWVKVQNLSRRYGADTDITWWWNEGQIPETPLGLLRINGLVYVGKIREGKRRFRIAAVPVELRKALAKIAREPQSMEGSPPLKPSDTRDGSTSPCRQEDLLDVPMQERTSADCWTGLESFNLRSFLSVCPLREDTEGIYTHTLGRIRRNPEGFPKRHVREFLTRMIRGRSVWSRLEAYKVGWTILDERFVAPALTDSSRMIQQWAQGVLVDPQEKLF